MELLDVTRADTKLWLVKVPTTVAQIWRPLCEQAMRSTGIDEDENGVELGTIKAMPSKGDPSKKEMLLTLKGAETKGVPSQFRMNQIPGYGGGSMAAVSYKAPQQEGEEPSQMRVDGTIERSFNLMPIHKVDENGVIEIDEAYRSLSKTRSINAAIKTHPVQMYEDTRENRMGTLIINRAMQDQKRKAESQRQLRLENKRLRKDKPELEAELFRLFERQTHWAFPQLQRETNQPAQYLKEVLMQVAFQNKRGPNRELYEIKHEYRDGGKKEGEAL